MIYKVADGDVLKILPIPRKNGKFDLCRVTSCAFMDNKMIYDLDESKGYLRRMCYSHRKNNSNSSRNDIQLVKRHFFCVYIDGKVKFISVGAKLMDVITGYDKFDVKDDNHLLISIKMMNAGNNMLPSYDNSKIIKRDWIKPVSNINDQEEWLVWIRNNQPGYLEDFLERNSLMNNIPSVRKAFGSDLLSEIIQEDRDNKLEKLLNKNI
ncbi:MAG TPA: hypothetical protein PKG93_05115 [Bacilli bacterium]|nr:hypothetical protein [Bacilli bacterium]